MSEKKPKDSAPTDADKLFFELLPEIPIALRRACRKLSYSPDPAAFDGLVQQIIFLLLEKDSHRLRSFDHRASAKTWLDRVVRNYLGTHLGKLRRESSLEELPPDSFLSLPDQEEKLLALERKRLLRKAIQKLTSREQMLFQLLCDEGLTMTAVAKNLRVKPATAYRYKHDLIKKLYLLIKVSGGGAKIEEISSKIFIFKHQEFLD